ncbi:efflux RND transporter permease subunit [Plebeiibacterium sediminum]|uniref:Efflux RND transporter permease subunit n=1 Tax=Plebeiibacterium sediminum TaxID=2992112 RepID=A0AAE3SEP2_9BACT|nr:efflux RND transporter permease subunit [Plebeiobacterium sediminum]MCW3786391.1 efflux RND transporter permease subunit [Plebeiobacterium sediminum]
MNLAEYTLKNRVFVYFILVLVFIGGIVSYFNVGKLEDAEFTIKTALVVTRYPGASQYEVEQEVTEKIERAAQQMDNIDEIYSSSYAGLSIIQIDLKESMRAKQMPQEWDILRKKINDIRGELPPAAMTPTVVDDFGDVYGMFYALTGEGYSQDQINDYARFIQRELLTVGQVGKIILFGDRTECVDLVINHEKLSELGVNPGVIIGALNAQSTVAEAGTIQLNDLNVRVAGNTAFNSIEDIKNTIVNVGPEQFYLKDLVQVKKSYLEPVTSMQRFNNKQAVGIGISTINGGNVLTMAENINAKLEQVTAQLPVGLELHTIYDQAREVNNANDVFIVNLIESIIIVIVILLVSMGLRSGILISSGLLFSIFGTLIAMKAFNISLHRTSLSAIIIAMGMLVDNAIVVTDGILVSLQRGLKVRKAIVNVGKSTAWPLLGATFIAILAFLPVFLAPNSAGEINEDLFKVLAISLGLSWIFAMTQTPLVCERFLKPSKDVQNPFDGKWYKMFKSVLEKLLKYRRISLAGVLILLVGAIIAFGHTKKAFFMPLEKNYTLVDYWLPEGSNIHKVSSDLATIEAYLLDSVSEVKNVTTSIGQTPPRYILSAQTQSYNSSYGQLMIETHDLDEIETVNDIIRNKVAGRYPDARFRIKGYIGGPPIEYKVEGRFIGPDPAVLRDLANQAEEILRSEPACGDITNDWRNKVLVWEPKYSQVKAGKAGITRADLGSAILSSTSTGLGVGLYRDNDVMRPIFLKTDQQAQNNLDRIVNTQIWGRNSEASVPLKEIVENQIEVSFENSVIQRYNRQRAITVQCDPVDPNMSGASLKDLVGSKLEAIPLPSGYSFMWDGEYKPSLEANEATGTYMPLAMLLIVLIVVMLFNSIRQSLIVMAIIPLSIIGVSIGLFVTGKAFGFMAITGFLGLIGMVLKNAIVMMDEINLNLNMENVSPYEAVVNAAVSRMRPVLLAALTTIFGMFPLITDAMYGSMAVTIIFGLFFATFLTLLVLPLFYVLFYKIKPSN